MDWFRSQIFPSMNIFVLHLNPRLAAEMHCDKHVVKMILETAQLLYSAHWLLCPEELPEGAYKKTHVNHPCSIWVRQSIVNYHWLCELGWWLCKEYQYRYPKSNKPHKTETHILWLRDHPPKNIPLVDATPFPQAMPVEFKHSDPVVAYETFYRESKMKARGIVQYTRRPTPAFLLENSFT